MGAPLGLLGSPDGSCRPSSPNQEPHCTGNNSPFLVILPDVSTRNLSPVPPELLLLEEPLELLDELEPPEDELELLELDELEELELLELLLELLEELELDELPPSPSTVTGTGDTFPGVAVKPIFTWPPGRISTL
jgi:hypothetical protein